MAHDLEAHFHIPATVLVDFVRHLAVRLELGYLVEIATLNEKRCVNKSSREFRQGTDVRLLL